jgi:glyoxylase I family protein
VSQRTFHHVDLVVSDIDRSLAFYRGLLEPLGWSRVGTIVGERGETVWYIGGLGAALGLRAAQSDSHPTPYDRYALGVHHAAFAAPSREVVDERHRWLVATGAAIESPPKEYEYIPGYYAVFFYDPDDIKLEIVHVPER